MTETFAAELWKMGNVGTPIAIQVVRTANPAFVDMGSIGLFIGPPDVPGELYHLEPEQARRLAAALIAAADEVEGVD